jgi:hypothetical protein
VSSGLFNAASDWVGCCATIGSIEAADFLEEVAAALREKNKPAPGRGARVERQSSADAVPAHALGLKCAEQLPDAAVGEVERARLGEIGRHGVSPCCRLIKQRPAP